jgi:type IV pilus assembly protein PilE
MDCRYGTPVAPGRRRDAAFSLIELMVAIAIVAILATIAIPSYREHLRRGAVEEVTAALGSGKVVFEQFFLDNQTYQDAPCPANAHDFAITCESDATSFSITGTGSGIVQGFVYTIDEADARTTAGPWVAGGGTASCWITRKGDTC